MLFRAVYADADIYLLDTPLSAVDPNVGAHILQNCILGLLKNKIRIIATQNMDLIQSADFIYILEHGSVKESGSPANLFKNQSKSTKLIFNSAPVAESQKDTDVYVLLDDRNDSESGNGSQNFKAHETSKGVPVEVYKEYFQAGIPNLWILFKFLYFTAFTHLLLSGSEYWLKYW